MEQVSQVAPQSQIFVDGPQNVAPADRDLFEMWGVFAYSIIAGRESQERELEDYLWWERHSPLRPSHDPDAEDLEIDLGPEEPDDF